MAGRWGLDRLRPEDPFVDLHYREEPDFTQPTLAVPAAAARRIRARLERLYGGDRVEAAYAQVERVMRVFWAHTTPEIRAAEAALDPRERLTEKDVLLVTYGDLILSEDRNPLQTLADFARAFFGRVITTIHVLPFFPFSSDRGFSVKSYLEVDPRLGGWEDIDRLSSSFRLMFDGVFNHASARSVWFRQFLNGDPDYADFFIAFHTREAVDPDRLRLILRPRTSELLTCFQTLDGPRWLWTTFSADQIDLNFKSPKVLYRVLEVMLQYVRRGADLVRLDAVTYLWHELGTSCAHLEETHAVVKLLRDVLDVVAPHVALVTETNVPHADNVTYFGDGHDEAQLIYNFALPPLVLHAFLRGDASVLAAWAEGLEPPSETTAFLNFLDSHDGIGVMGARGVLPEQEILALCERVVAHGGYVSMKSNGDGSESPYELNITWFSALNREDDGEPVARQVARFLASRAVALALRGVPAIYLPSFFGARNDREAVELDQSRRSINRATLHERVLLEAFGDRDALPARILERYLRLLEARVAEPAFHPAAPQRVLRVDPRVLALLRSARDASSRVLALVNVSAEAVALDLELGGLGLAGRPLVDLAGGPAPRVAGGHLELVLGPYDVAWLRG